MIRRIGIRVDASMIRAVVIHRGHIVATAAREPDDSTSVASQVASLFATFDGLAKRASVRIAFDRPAAQFKIVDDAPQLADRRLLERALLENADRYFIGGGASRQFGVRANGENAGIVACDRRVVDEIGRSAFAAGASSLVVFSAASLPVSNHIEGDPGFDAAYSVAMVDERTIPAIVVRPAHNPRGRRIVATLAAAVTPIALLASPVIRVRQRAAAARVELTAIARQSSVAIKARDDRAALQAMIDRVRPAGIVMTDLLADITNALPARTSLLALTVDSLKGSAVILAFDAVETLPSLDSIHAIDHIRLSGPVTRERIADRDLERATIVFSLRTIR